MIQINFGRDFISCQVPGNQGQERMLLGAALLGTLSVHYLYPAMHHSGSTYCLSQVALQKDNQFDENEITQEIDRMNKLSHTVSLLITARLVDANGRIVCLSFTRSLNILRLESYILGQ